MCVVQFYLCINFCFFFFFFFKQKTAYEIYQCDWSSDVCSSDLALKEAAGGTLSGIMQYTEEPLVSIDLNGNPHSSIDRKSVV